jgi:regulator of protease activity HflC (stomatin/prohibitin superfamily)
MRKLILPAVAVALSLLMTLVWLAGSRNPETPAGYVGYLTQGAVFGKATFWGLQAEPTSPGRTWLLSVVNVSVTPYTYSEDFAGSESVLSKDNLKVSFRVHVVWKVRADRVKEFVERDSTLYDDRNSDKVVRVAYGNYLREPLRTYARDEIQRLNGLEIKDRITPIGDAIFRRVLDLTRDTPFQDASVVVGNIQYPEVVADAVSRKMAATQELERKQTEILIEEKEKQKRIVQAEGIARAMEIINLRLTAQYLQHEAIEAQKAMVNSPNHTTIYIPVGPMGVPLVGTVNQPTPASPVR